MFPELIPSNRIEIRRGESHKIIIEDSAMDGWSAYMSVKLDPDTDDLDSLAVITVDGEVVDDTLVFDITTEMTQAVAPNTYLWDYLKVDVNGTVVKPMDPAEFVIKQSITNRTS